MNCTHLECGRVFRDLTLVLVVEQGVKEDEVQVFVDLEWIFILVLR